MADNNTHTARVFFIDPLAICSGCNSKGALYADAHGTFCGRCGPSFPMSGIGYDETNTLDGRNVPIGVNGEMLWEFK